MIDERRLSCFLNVTIGNRWDINTKRNINYRSLAPIISLLGVEHTPECQLWAAWAVANLTLFDEDKYCPLVEEEGGLAAITRIMEAILRESLTSSTSSKISGRLLELGQKATHNINEHKKRMNMIERCGNTLVLLEVRYKILNFVRYCHFVRLYLCISGQRFCLITCLLPHSKKKLRWLT